MENNTNQKQDCPLVFVRCLTFNHEAYIEDALNGFVMQQTNFPFVVTIVNDASPDNTKNVIKTFIKKICDSSSIQYEQTSYADIIKATPNNNSNCFLYVLNLYENHFQKKSHRPYYQEYVDKAKYWAECEGDDYWTYPLKLQKQVDFMEANPEYSICFHKVKRLIQQTGEFKDEIDVIDMPGRSTIVDLVEGNYIHTPSALYRIYPKIIKQHLNMIPCLFGDYTTWLLLANKGDIFKFEDIMAVYRVGNGAFSSTKWNTKHKLELIILFSQLYTLIDNDVAKQKIHEMVICQKRYIMDDLKMLSIQLDKIQSTRLYKLIRVLTSPMRFVKSYFKRKNSNIR